MKAGLVAMLSLATAGGFSAGRGISVPVPGGFAFPRGRAQRELTDEDLVRLERAKAKRARKASARQGAR